MVPAFPIISRRVKTPRAYFTNTQPHHCCHEDVDAAKHVIISDQNQDRCGVRSGTKGDVFCEIAPVDEFILLSNLLFPAGLHRGRGFSVAVRSSHGGRLATLSLRHTIPTHSLDISGRGVAEFPERYFPVKPRQG